MAPRRPLPARVAGWVAGKPMLTAQESGGPLCSCFSWLLDLIICCFALWDLLFSWLFTSALPVIHARSLGPLASKALFGHSTVVLL